MKVEQPDAHLLCQICGHEKQVHMQVCGDRDCECLCFLPPPGTLESPPPFHDWQEQAFDQFLDLILAEKDGEIVVKTNGKTCKVRVQFLPDIGMTVYKVGSA